MLMQLKSYLQKFRVRQGKLLDDLGAGSPDVRVLPEEAHVLVVVNLNDLVRILKLGDTLGRLRQFQLLDTKLLQCDAVVHKAE